MITNSKWLQISYSSLKEQGVIDDLGNLKPNHDAASVNCGENWRMPTLKEAAELHMCCKWIFLARNGIRGYMVVGPNGKAIYLPAAGWKVIDHLMDVSSHGYYWTSTADDYGYVSDKIQQNYSYYMEVFDNYGGTYRNTRSCGFTVRAVLGKW